MAENQVSKRPVKDFLKSDIVQKSIKDTLGAKAQQFTASVLALVGSDELLAIAEPNSLLSAALTAAALDLPINKNLGYAHIIGYKNNDKGIVEAQFQMGAKGFKQLAQRTGQYLVINDTDVRLGEIKSRDRLSGTVEFEWCENDEDRAELPIIGYVSYFELLNGFKSTVYMSLEEVTKHGKRYSQSFKRRYGPWVDNFDAMALKTVTKRNLSANGPMSTELQKALISDQAVIRDDKEDYVDGVDLDTVKASDEKKAEILAANGVQDLSGDAPGRTDVDTLVDDPANFQPTEPKKPEAPKESVKEKAMRKYGPKQTSLVDEQNDSPS